jgi:hypothetical protein
VSPRNRGPRWSSPKQADRGRPLRSFSLPRDLHTALDCLRVAGANVSAIAEEALRAHPKVAAELARASTDDEHAGLRARGLLPCDACDGTGHDQRRARLGSGLVDCRACHGRGHVLPLGVGSGPCPSKNCPFARCTDPAHWDTRS